MLWLESAFRNLFIYAANFHGLFSADPLCELCLRLLCCTKARQRWHCTRPPLWTDGLDSTPKRQERFRSLNGLIDARPTEHKHDDLPVT